MITLALDKNVPDALFPRNFLKSYPEAVRGRDCFIQSADGRKILDACGGAAVVSIGHGVDSVARAMGEQASSLAYVHSSRFTTRVAAELARRILELAPRNFRDRQTDPAASSSPLAVQKPPRQPSNYLASIFSSAMSPDGTQFVSRWQSYHGSTLGALAVWEMSNVVCPLRRCCATGRTSILLLLSLPAKLALSRVCRRVRRGAR